MIIHKTNNVTVFQSAMFQLNTTVVTTEDLILVVDPGYLPYEIEKIRLYVDRIKGDRPIYLFFTHSDFDHIVGYGAFLDAKTIASEQFVTNNLKESQLQEAINYDDEYYIVRPYQLVYPSIDYMIKEDGERFQVGNTLLTFYYALGHNHDGLIGVIESEKLAIVGDYLSDIEFPFVYFSFEQYDRTLKSLSSIFKENRELTLITSHGTVTSDQSEIIKRLNDSYEYLEFVKRQGSGEQFEQFMKEKNYLFSSVFRKRHQDNLRVYGRERDVSRLQK